MIYSADDLTFNILTIGRHVHACGNFGVKARQHAALSFRVEGNGRFNIGGLEFSSNRGDIVFIPDGVPYEVEYSGGESIAIHMKDCSYRTPENISGNFEYFRKAFDRLLFSWEEAHSANRAKAGIFELLENIRTAAGAENSRELYSCRAFVEEGLSDSSFNTERLCKAVGMSESSVRRMFVANFGMSPKKYILKLRCERAISLLARGEHSVKEVAALCGFSDEKYFSRVIKQRYSLPPSEIFGK